MVSEAGQEKENPVRDDRQDGDTKRLLDRGVLHADTTLAAPSEGFQRGGQVDPSACGGPTPTAIQGWSPSTPTKMVKRYGRIGNAAHRQAVSTLDPATKGAQDVGTETDTVTEESETAKAVND
jgi:hypothetical protein